MELVLSTEVESMDDDAPVIRSRYNEGRFRSDGSNVEGHELSVVGMSSGGAGYECNSEESFEATGLGIEGGGKAPMSC